MNQKIAEQLDSRTIIFYGQIDAKRTMDGDRDAATAISWPEK
jgi:hypothetical protein